MVNWEDREYVNPRKKVFKNLDTEEILILELQDDPDNVTKEGVPVTAHNLNKMQTDLKEEIRKDTTIDLTTQGWYRVAKCSSYKNGNFPGTSCILKLTTSYSNGAPMTVTLNAITSYTSALIKVLSMKKYSDTVHFSKARIQYNSETRDFFLDVYYNMINKTNSLNINAIAKDEFWEVLTDTTITEYETVQEISLTASDGEEFLTGRIINGKEEYGKRIDFGALPNNTSKTISHGINFSKASFISMQCDFQNTNGYKISFQNYGIDPTSNSSSIIAFIGNSVASIKTSSNMSNYTGFVTICYTKN